MDFAAHASLLSASLCAALAAAIATRHRVHPTHRAFFLLTLALAGWNAAYLFYLVTLRPVPLRLLLLCSFAIPPAVIHFFRRFFYEELPAIREVRRLSIWASLGLGLATLLLPNQPLPLVGTALLRVMIALSAVYLIAAFGYGTYLLHGRQLHEPHPVDKTRLRYLRNGAIVVLVALVIETLWAPFSVGLRTPRVAAMALTAYAYFIYLSILNYRLLEIQEILGRTILVGAAGGVLALMYMLIAALAGDSLAVVYLYTLIGFLVLLLLYRPVRSYLETQIERWFFGKSYAIKEVSETLTNEMMATRTAEELLSLVLREFARLERVTDVSAYLWNPRLGKFAFAGGRGGLVAMLPNTISRKVPLVDAVERAHGPLLRADLEARQEQEVSAALKDEVTQLIGLFEKLRAELIVPMFSGEKCAGFFALQDERAIETYATSEVRAFCAVANTASLLLEHFRAIEELRERERLASLGEMAAGLAHEIRNPLSSIKGAVQYLEDEVEIPDKAREFFDVIVEETDRLSSVVSEFLDYARHPVLKRRPVDLGELTEKTLKQLALEEHAPEARIEMNLAQDLPPAQADPGRIKQVLINLVQNAVAVQEGGGHVRVSTFRDGDYVCFSVTDTGPGMDAKTRERIFTPFFTTREGGVGLGLPISHRIVESHGGLMQVRSSPGEGSEFTVKLPIARAIAGEGQTPGAKQAGGAG